MGSLLGRWWPPAAVSSVPNFEPVEDTAEVVTTEPQPALIEEAVEGAIEEAVEADASSAEAALIEVEVKHNANCQPAESDLAAKNPELTVLLAGINY